MATTFDKAKGIYRNAKGKEIPYADIRAAVDAVANDTKARLRELAQRHIDNKMTFPAWATESEELIRKSLIASGQIAAGGRAQMTPTLNGRLGARVKFHLDKFREFGLERERGEVSDAEMLTRTEMYGDAGVNVYETLRQGVMIDAGFTEAKNILGEANHCAECPALSAAGWMPIADMKPVGSRACMSRDRCTVIYR